MRMNRAEAGASAVMVVCRGAGGKSGILHLVEMAER